MGLFDALSGRIGHFNQITVPVYNELSRNIQTFCTPEEQSFFGVVSLYGVGQRMIDLFFKPGPNSLINSIKNYNQNDIRNLYSIFMIWMTHDLINFSEDDQKKDGIKNKLKKILNLGDKQFEHYFSILGHGKELPINIEKLWQELILIIKDLPNTEENYLIFQREFATKKNEALRAM